MDRRALVLRIWEWFGRGRMRIIGQKAERLCGLWRSTVKSRELKSCAARGLSGPMGRLGI